MSRKEMVGNKEMWQRNDKTFSEREKKKKKNERKGDISSKWHPKPTPIIFGSHASEADLIKERETKERRRGKA